MINREYEDILRHGHDILISPGMSREKKFFQHGNISVYEHSVSTAALCLKLARLIHIKTNEAALIRGALLHDYFLYDWHTPDKSHRWHGFTHAKCALKNAERDFDIGKIEKDMIKRHMFPLNPYPPKYRESVILCIADKLCAVRETVRGLKISGRSAK